jgi:hypothetical protein
VGSVNFGKGSILKAGIPKTNGEVGLARITGTAIHDGDGDCDARYIHRGHWASLILVCCT